MLDASVARILSALRPESDLIKDFVKTKTYLRGRPFSTKHHEYQDILMDELSNPDVEFVCFKVAQAGASEIIYRVLLSFAANLPGFSAALVLPSLTQTTEVMKLRLAGIIDESPLLSKLIDRKVNSSSVKRLQNGSVLYALSGSGTSKSTAITRPIRCIVADELQYIDMKTLTNMVARQRHQDHKSTIYLSSPRFKGCDIDAELAKCGSIKEAILKCDKCNHEFFPSFYDHVRLPGYSGDLRRLTLSKVSAASLDVDAATLNCPKCSRAIPFGYPHTHWVDVAENPNLPKRGMKVGPFDIPHYVGPADLIRDMIRMDDRQEFEAQFLAIPIEAKKNALDTSQVRFVHDEAGSLNVFGLDVGKVCCLTIGSVAPGNSGMLIHLVEFIPVKDIKRVMVERLREYRCLAGVIDLLPYSDLTKFFIDTIPNTWAALYENTKKAAARLELFSLKKKEDDALGDIRVININTTPSFDHFANQVLNGLLAYKSSEMDGVVKSQLSVMSRQRDRVFGGGSDTYRWMKPDGKAQDHIHHSSVYCMLAGKLLTKSRFTVPRSVSTGIHVMKKRLQ